VVAERQAMHLEVNRRREELDKEPIDISEVVLAENAAKRHADYQQRFAWYCTDLVHDDKVFRS